MLRIGQEIIISDHKAAFSLDISVILWRFPPTVLENTFTAVTPPDSMALFCALFLHVKILLGCFLGYPCIHRLPGVPDMSKPQG